MWTDHMRDIRGEVDLHWWSGKQLRNDIPLQVQHATRSTESSGAGLRYWGIDDLLQPALAGGDGQDLRSAGGPGDVRGRRDAGGVCAGAAAVCAAGDAKSGS